MFSYSLSVSTQEEKKGARQPKYKYRIDATVKFMKKNFLSQQIFFSPDFHQMAFHI